MAGTITIGAYQTFGGQRIPSQMQIGYAGLPITVNATLIGAHTLATVDPALFALPQLGRRLRVFGTPPARRPTCRSTTRRAKSSCR